MARLRAWIWPLLRALYPSVRVQSLDIVNVGLIDRSLESSEQLFREAMRFVEMSGEDLNQVLVNNLRRIALVRGRSRIAVAEGKYGTTLLGVEGRNSFYLACRLLWVAKYIELARETRGFRRNDSAIRNASFDAVAEFASRFPEGDEWIRYMERERMRDQA